MQATVIKITPAQIYFLNERSLTIELGKEISEANFLKVSLCDQLIHDHPFPGFITTIPAYISLTVVFDPVQVMGNDLIGNTCFEKVSAYLISLNPVATQPQKTASDTIVIPVCYGGNLGPDLDEVAGLHNISSSEVISLHTAAIYTVYMIGFVPGFAYLGGMNASLATPRKATPRAAVPAGSVGIAGLQTGVYPLATPGGWQIIGQTPLKMFDANRAEPSLLKAGDRIKFEAISLDEFNHIKTGD